MEEHKASIQAVLKGIFVNGDEGVVVDEIFILRFVLSAKKDTVAVSIRHVNETLMWRRENRTLLDLVASGNAPWNEKYSVNSQLGQCGVLGGFHPIFVVRAGKANTKALCNDFSHEEMTKILLMNNEIGYRLADQRTRETGRLCKVIAVIDLAGFSMFKFDSRFPKAQGASSHQSAIFYPQLQGRAVVVNAPIVFQWLFALFSRFMSESSKEKSTLCGVSGSWRKSSDDCPFIKSFEKGSEQIPAFLGGTMPCPKVLFRADD